jgi:hypothetical protein
MNKAMKIFVLGVLVLAAYAQPALAREFADIYSDCGIGAIIAPRNGGVAAVTNVTWDCGTTAISSNVTTPGSCQGGQERAAAFIHESYASLEKDIASGSGDHLNTLLTLAGHDADQEFAAALRQGFASVVATPGFSEKSRFEKAQALYELVYQNS